MKNQNATPSETAYREDTHNVNHSALRLFNECPNLFNEQYNLGTYEEPDKDYFIYGSLVDKLLTAPNDVDSTFCRVKTKLDPSDALKFEMKIKELQAEMESPDKKGETMIEKAARGNKTAISGIEKRELEIEEYKDRLAAIRSFGSKQQVTNAMWVDAHETAEAIKNNPFFKTLTFDEFTSQQVFIDVDNRRKGQLDYINFLHPTAKKLYAAYRSGLIDHQTYYTSIQELPESARRGIIVDIKTTYLISKFEPSSYDTQLAYYQKLVEAVTGIKCDCYIIAGDKDGLCKRAQDYKLSQPLLDRAWDRISQVEKAYWECKENNIWPSAKELWGTEQECFRCSICKDRPFSLDEPLLVEGLLFR